MWMNRNNHFQNWMVITGFFFWEFLNKHLLSMHLLMKLLNSWNLEIKTSTFKSCRCFVFSFFPQTFLNTVAKWIPEILVNSPCLSSLCWQLLARVQINAKGMICLFFIEIVSHPHLASSILRRILMQRYQRGIIFFFFTIYLAMIYWLWLPPSQRITDPFWEIRFSHLSWVCMWHRSPETVWGETDFEEQWCVNLSGVTPLLPGLCPMNGPVILSRSVHHSLYSCALFICW